MRINPSISQIQPTDAASRAREGGRVTPAGDAAAGPVASSPRVDRVEISDAGRALAARGDAEQAGGLTPERLVELRQKVLGGAYGSLEVVDAIARRMLERGDV